VLALKQQQQQRPAPLPPANLHSNMPAVITQTTKQQMHHSALIRQQHLRYKGRPVKYNHQVQQYRPLLLQQQHLFRRVAPVVSFSPGTFASLGHKLVVLDRRQMVRLQM
jgi:hypothetical protein